MPVLPYHHQDACHPIRSAPLWPGLASAFWRWCRQPCRACWHRFPRVKKRDFATSVAVARSWRPNWHSALLRRPGQICSTSTGQLKRRFLRPPGHVAMKSPRIPYRLAGRLPGRGCISLMTTATCCRAASLAKSTWVGAPWRAVISIVRSSMPARFFRIHFLPKGACIALVIGAGWMVTVCSISLDELTVRSNCAAIASNWAKSNRHCWLWPE